MSSKRRYQEVVPEAVQRYESDHGLSPADWYVRSGASAGVYIESLEAMFPEPENGADAEPSLAHEGEVPAGGLATTRDGVATNNDGDPPPA
jgi:hypothetical protein